MKKLLTIAVAAVMLLGACISTVSAETPVPMVNELSSIGQQTSYLGAPAAPPVIDGRVDAGEYAWSRTFKVGDPGTTCSITNDAAKPGYVRIEVSYDENYIYMAGVVQEDEYTKKGSVYSSLALNLGFNFKGDSISAADRFAMTLSINENGSFFTGINYMKFATGGTFAANWGYMSKLFENKMFTRSTDADGKAITTYEIQIKKSVVKEAFGLEEIGDSFYFYFYQSSTLNGVKAGEFRYQATLNSEALEAVKAQYGWSATFYGHIMTMRNNTLSTALTASIRTANPTGLRFATTVDKEFYDGLVSQYGAENVKTGTLIAPASYVAEAGAFTKTALDALTKSSEKYLDVVSEKFYDRDSDSYTFVGSVASVRSGHLELDFAGIGYIEAGGQIYYSAGYAVRNVSEIAKAALKDTKAAAEGAYVNEMKMTGGVTVYSRYTYEQRVEINKLAVWNGDEYAATIDWER